VIAAVKRHPQRFYGYFMLNGAAADAAERVQHALVSGLRGVCLFPAMHRYSIQDERLHPVFETVSQWPGTLVFVHCGVLTVGVRSKLGLASPFDMRFSNPIDLHAVALRFPRVNFVVPHFGAGYFREALMLCDLCANVYLDTSSSNSWMKYQSGPLDLAAVFRRALDVLGPQRLLFGTDSSFFPRGWHKPVFDRQVEILRQLPVSAADAAWILGGNLHRLLER
jgi:predicted TIM-barrel fold metal-dependent hydrolase